MTKQQYIVGWDVNFIVVDNKCPFGRIWGNNLNVYVHDCDNCGKMSRLEFLHLLQKRVELLILLPYVVEFHCLVVESALTILKSIVVTLTTTRPFSSLSAVPSGSFITSS